MLILSGGRLQKDGSLASMTGGSGVQLPARKKVIETEPEPAFTELPNTGRNVAVLVSANVSHSKYELKEDSLRFRDTLMFQSRVYQLVHFD